MRAWHDQMCGGSICVYLMPCYVCSKLWCCSTAGQDVPAFLFPVALFSCEERSECEHVLGPGLYKHNSGPGSCVCVFHSFLASYSFPQFYDYTVLSNYSYSFSTFLLLKSYCTNLLCRVTLFSLKHVNFGVRNRDGWLICDLASLGSSKR